MPKPAKSAQERFDEADPPAAQGFQEWSEAEESRLERPSTPEIDPEAYVIVSRVVYLGTARRKSVILPGSLIEHARPDGSKRFVPVPKTSPTTSVYNFERLDANGQWIFERMTHDQHPFAICRHMRHLAWFYEQVDPEGGPVYELRGPRGTLEKVQRYISMTRDRAARNPEAPANILAAMGINPAETEIA